MKKFKSALINIIFIISIVILFILFHLKINISPSSPLGVYYVYKPKKINKGDYIIYDLPEKYQKYMNDKLLSYTKGLTIKKVYAAKGDYIDNKDGQIYINGEPKGKVNEYIESSFETKELEENEYFTLSDEEQSLDSRYYGPIKKENIKGKGILIYKFKIEEKKKWQLNLKDWKKDI